MSDFDEIWGVTYTEVSSPFEGLSDIGSPRADDHEYLELSGMPKDPYMEAALQAPPSPDYPYADNASPTAQSPDYVPKSDPEADPEEDDDEDPEEDPVDYPADGGDDGNDEEGSSEDDEDDDINIEADEDEEEEEHSTPANSVVVALPATNQALSAADFYSSSICVPTPVWSDAEVARLLAISTPPSSPLSPWSSPLPQIPSPSLPLSPPSLVLSPAPPPSPIHAPSSGIPPPLRISVPTSSPPLLLPSTSRESSSAAAARPAGGLRTDYGFVATIDREIRRDPEREVGYGITDSWDEIVEILQGAPRLDCPERLGGDRWMRCDSCRRDGLCQLRTNAILAAAYTDIDSDAVIIGTGDHTTGTGDSTTGTGYRTTGTAGGPLEVCIAKAARGGW
ncbi:hypothetical protein Tco_0688623 [Tanacetum coccineum]